MPLAYPPDIVAKDFIDGSGSLSIAKTLGTDDRPALGISTCTRRDSPQSQTVSQELCAVTKITIEAGGKVSQSFVARKHPNIASGDNTRVNFAPKLETTTIRWTVEKPELVTSARIEIFRRGQSNPIWSIATPQLDLASGNLNYDGASTATRLFPSNFLNVEHGPYKLKITIEGPYKPKLNETFTYFDVVMHSITLRWGTYNQLPRTRGTIKGENLKLILGDPVVPTTGYEELAFNSITLANPAPGAGLQHKVELIANLFAKKPATAMETEEASNRTDFELYRDLWGSGARIPIIAEVLVKKADGKGTDQAPEALAGCRLLWDWQDPNLRRWRVGLTPTTKTEDFVRDIFSQNEVTRPKNVANCPRELGGKLGDPEANVFSRTSGARVFPYKVDPCGKRTWASFSRFPTAGTAPEKCTTGAIFNPSRIAGDAFVVVCALYFDRSMDSTNDVVIPAAAKAEAGTFEVFKKTTLFYLTRGGPAELAQDPATIEATLKDIYLKECKTVLDLRRSPIDNNAYKQALQLALVDAEKQASFYQQLQIVPLVTRNVVDLNPPANSPGVVYKTKVDFFNALEQTFRNGRLRLITVGGMLPGEEIVGASSGAKGIPLTLMPTQSDVPVKVLCDPGTDFAALEMVRGGASQKIASAQTSPVKSCWGHTYLEVVRTVSRYDDAIDVAFAGQDVKVKYGRTGIKRRVLTIVSNSAKRDLEEAFAQASLTFNESSQLIITLVHKGVTDHSAERLKNLKAAIDAILLEGKGLLDREACWNDLRTNVWSFLSQDADYTKVLQEFFADTILIPLIVERYARLQHQHDQGIFLVHIPGRCNARLLPELNKRITFGNVRDYEDKPLVAAYYGSTFFNDRNKAVTYVSTLDPNGANMYKEPMKSVPSIFAHEVGHAIFLPHAPEIDPTKNDAAGTKVGCHVKGDNCLMNYDVGSEHFCGVCMLRMRGWDWKPLPNTLGEQEYQVTVELDDVDTLFSAPATTPAGQRERLQVLGMLNRPLDHPEIGDCFNFSWTHFKDLFPELEGASNTLVTNFFKQKVADCLVEGGHLPLPGAFAKIRIPSVAAMYSQNYLAAANWEWEGQPRGKPYDDFMLGADHYKAEDVFYAANPALGKIPLKATVRRRVLGSADPWIVAPQARVFFQLVQTGDITTAPAGPPGFINVVGGKTYQTGIRAPDMNPTPKAYYKSKVEDYKPTTADPDGKNVHKDLGGKRGATVFAKPRSGNFADIPFDPKAPFAASADADQNGVARILFSPSRAGGDIYRLRVFVGPPTQERTKDQLDAALLLAKPEVVETGNMVRWRMVRVCHDIVMEPAADQTEVPAGSCEKADTSLMPNVANYFGDLATLDLPGICTRELAKAYCELIIEPMAEQEVSISLYAADIKATAIALARKYPRFNTTAYTNTSIHREPMPVVGGSGDLRFSVVLQTPPEKKFVTIRPKGGGLDSALAIDETGAFVVQPAAQATLATVNVNYATGQVDATFSGAQTGKQYDVCYHPAKYVDINQILLGFPATSPFLFNLALPRVYNPSIGVGTKPADSNPLDEAAIPLQFHTFINAQTLGLGKAVLLDAAVRGVNRNGGFYPGLLFFRARAVDNYTAIWPTATQQGKGVGNGVFLFGGTADQPTFNSLMVHEMSHCLMLMHASTAPGARPKEHDPADRFCVMSYDPNDGDHCGQCAAALRGVNTRLETKFP